MSPALRTSLLRLARTVVEREVRNGDGRNVVIPASDDPQRPSFGGAFVTIKNGGRLRGCIGTFRRHGTLEETVRDMAASAVADPRFTRNAIGIDELPDLTIEVSVLTDLVPTSEPLSLVPGRDGIFIRQNEQTGCFLPQVASENGWDAREFLSRCCEMKARLPRDAWADPRTDICVFQTEAFCDPPPGPHPTEES